MRAASKTSVDGAAKEMTKKQGRQEKKKYSQKTNETQQRTKSNLEQKSRGSGTHPERQVERPAIETEKEKKKSQIKTEKTWEQEE